MALWGGEGLPFLSILEVEIWRKHQLLNFACEINESHDFSPLPQKSREKNILPLGESWDILMVWAFSKMTRRV